VHTIFPRHRVFQIAPDGTTPRQLLSRWPAAMAAPLAGHEVHGGPPVVHIPGELLTEAGLASGNSTSSSGSGSGSGSGRGGDSGDSGSEHGSGGEDGSGAGGARAISSSDGGGEPAPGAGAPAPPGYHLGVLHYFTVNSTIGPKGRKKDTKVRRAWD
jgi:hypothetical protein